MEELGIDRRVVLNFILRNEDGGCGVNTSDSGQAPVAYFCERGSESFVSIKGGTAAVYLVVFGNSE